MSSRISPALFLSISVLLPFAGARAQGPDGSIRGTVTSEAGAPLEGARVASLDPPRSVRSDRAGRFVLGEFQPGTYRITASFPGYRAATQDVVVRSGNGSIVRFQLVQEAAELEPLSVTGRASPPATSWLPEVDGAVLIGARKSEVIHVAATPGNLVENNPRQVYARVPGITVWELDGNGLQTNVAARGLNPHRSWEFLVSQNGFHVNSDLYGYPEAHYNPPLQAVDRIEIVRGTGALEFGPQFGGSLNYVLKRGDSTRRVSYESQLSGGSNRLIGSYNAIGGQLGRLNHYSYLDFRRKDGWRDQSGYDSYAFHTGVELAASGTVRIGLEYSQTYYVVQFAGGLTDAQFAADPEQARRSRNYFNPNMRIPAARLSWQVGRRTLVDVRAWGIIGERNSVQFIADPTVSDTVNPLLGSYNPRVVDRDYYRGFAVEARALASYRAFGQDQHLTGGIKLFDERTRRRQRGRGTTGSDFDLSLTAPAYLTDLNYYTRSAALFVEHALAPTSRLTVTTGVRYELIKTHFNGAIDAGSYSDAATRKRRNVALFGVGAGYRLGEQLSAYAGWSQAFRPVLYSDLIPSGSIARVDSSLRDARGWNGEIGLRGSVGRAFRFDLTAFQLNYPNRVGTVGVGAGAPGAYVLKTNVGGSVARGVEAYFAVRPLTVRTTGSVDLEVFSAIAYDHARYTDGSVVTGSGSGIANVSLDGKQVEGAPDWIVRSGVSATRQGFTVAVQHSRVSRTFADALNAPVSVNGSTGPVPGYGLVDLSVGYARGAFGLRAGVNNLGDTHYFTRRTNQYPGPGIIPSDGRTVFLTLSGRVP